MITTALGILGLVLGGGSVWGVAIRVLGWFTGSASVLGGATILGKAASRLIDVIAWALKGVVGYAAKWAAHALDYIAKDVKAATFCAALVWGSWAIGADKWAFWRSTEPPRQAAASSSLEPHRAARRQQSAQTSPRRPKSFTTELRDLVRNQISGGLHD